APLARAVAHAPRARRPARGAPQGPARRCHGAHLRRRPGRGGVAAAQREGLRRPPRAGAHHARRRARAAGRALVRPRELLPRRAGRCAPRLGVAQGRRRGRGDLRPGRRPGRAGPGPGDRAHGDLARPVRGAGPRRRDPLHLGREHRRGTHLREVRLHAVERRRDLLLRHPDDGASSSAISVSPGPPRGVTMGDVTDTEEVLASTREPLTPPEPLPEDRFADRELSWLAFNRRVLELAEDESLPLLERVRFLAIFASNLDEFFMVRVAGLKRRIATGLAVTAASGLSPRQVLDAISERAHTLAERHARVFAEQVQPALAAEGITVVRWQELGPQEQERLDKFFRKQIFPVLTPLAVDPAHPFPYISGLSLNLAVVVRNPATDKEHFARVKVPPLLPRFIAVDSRVGTGGPEGQDTDDRAFVPLEELISFHLDRLFPGMEVREHHTFRVTRNEDVEVEEDDAENLLQAMEKELLRRRFGPPVRLAIAADISPRIRDLLVRKRDVDESEVYELDAPLDLTGLSVVADLDRPELHFPKFVPSTHRQLAQVESAQPADVFAAIRERDILLHHPYDSFSTSVQAFLAQAAADPHVLAIKQTLYRTSGDSPIVDSLIDAAEAGKQVLAIVEIKARFDEEANISWARKLEQAGVHVVYGIVGLKTHCKLALVVRQEPDGLRRYCHIGTGNYNPNTARQYGDLGLLTCELEVGQDLT